MSKDFGDLKSELEIDKFNLDMECDWQPQLFEKYAKQLVAAEMNRDYAKAKVEIAIAQADLEIRKKKSKDFGLDKFSEAAIKSLITLDKGVQEATNDYFDAVEKAKNLAVVVKRIDSHRKHSLNNLIGLDARGYFARPTNPVAVRREVEKEESKAVQKEQKEMLKTRTRRVKREP